jgi:hypothetical protein
MSARQQQVSSRVIKDKLDGLLSSNKGLLGLSRLKTNIRNMFFVFSYAVNPSSIPTKLESSQKKLLMEGVLSAKYQDRTPTRDVKNRLSQVEQATRVERATDAFVNGMDAALTDFNHKVKVKVSVGRIMKEMQALFTQQVAASQQPVQPKPKPTPTQRGGDPMVDAIDGALGGFDAHAQGAIAGAVDGLAHLAAGAASALGAGRAAQHEEGMAVRTVVVSAAAEVGAERVVDTVVNSMFVANVKHALSAGPMAMKKSPGAALAVSILLSVFTGGVAALVGLAQAGITKKQGHNLSTGHFLFCRGQKATSDNATHQAGR